MDQLPPTPHHSPCRRSPTVTRAFAINSPSECDFFPRTLMNILSIKSTPLSLLIYPTLTCFSIPKALVNPPTQCSSSSVSGIGLITKHCFGYPSLISPLVSKIRATCVHHIHPASLQVCSARAKNSHHIMQ